MYESNVFRIMTGLIGLLLVLGAVASFFQFDIIGSLKDFYDMMSNLRIPRL